MATLIEYSALALALRDAMALDRLIETGTFRGSSTPWAAQHFQRVDTVEISKTNHATARKNTRRHKNVFFHFGDSRDRLPPLVKILPGPAMFWLDAHNGAHL